MNIQNRINALQPYVIGIRVVGTTCVVDTVLKDGWQIPESPKIKFGTSDESKEYFMFYSEHEGIELDHILNFVEQVIKVNIEREKKYDLLKVKIGELKDFFKLHKLDNLINMKFILSTDKLIPDVMTKDFDEVTIEDIDHTPVVEVAEEPIQKHTIDEVSTYSMQEQHNHNSRKVVMSGEIELPPKGKVILEEYDEPELVCRCDDGEVCPVCYDSKMDS